MLLHRLSVRGLVILWAAWPFKENIVHVSQCLWESWATVDRERRHADVFPFALFVWRGKKKYLFTNIDSFCPVWINMLFVKSLFFFLSSPFCSLTITSWYTSLCSKCTTPWREKKDQNTLNGLFASSVSVKMWQRLSPVHGGELTVCGTSVCDPEAEFYRFCHVASRQSCEPEHTNIQSLCPQKKHLFQYRVCLS